ncbi:alpha/beta hydrolase family protein [Sphaerisporangium perillae]|uniref:alpha/beta hydrolase family protein n=1 Tax=Sphaerisporangium perillae TaxID=2935860 RepID=UPI00200BC0B3|nr:alpha/beta hydrolase [Sphaerisporangium perillae]
MNPQMPLTLTIGLLSLSTLTAMAAAPGPAAARTPDSTRATAGSAANAPGSAANAPGSATTAAREITAPAAPRLALPEPTGRRPVGAASLHLVDSSRRDPWVPASASRELMVSLWYPAKKPAGPRARYVTPEESALILKGVPGVEGTPPDTVSKTRTHARVDAPPLPSEKGLPLVVMSPGFSFPRATLTSLGEDLASRGYLVAAVEHTYESVGTTFPDGRTTTCVACEGPMTKEKGEKVAGIRVADLSFVLDRLTADGRWSRLIDQSKIAMVGHSMGGNSAAQVMLADGRVKAGVNLDGTFLPTVGELTRPFLMIGTESGHSPGGKDTSWDESWRRLGGPKQWLTVAGTDHSSFTDYAVLREQLGISPTVIKGTRAVEITRAYVAAFLDRRLRHQPVRELHYTEVKSWK